nr:integrase, catalytic region, zinc finger, CCHC-type, peptidase aspartic, catalytic [Tanacetum cinerariifolium]
MTGDRSQLVNFVQKFLGMVKFGNDHVAKIVGYEDYQIGNVTISQVYYVEGLGHDLFSVGQFCDSDLEVAFRRHTCFIRNLDEVDLLTGSWGNNLYTLSIQDITASSPICLLSKTSKTKSWLWHRRLSHLNFGAINHLARQGLVRGISKLKFEKDHLCSACTMGKSTRKTHKPKSKDTNQEKLYLLHMDLCGPMRVESVNGKNENLGKLQPKADIRIFIGYAPTKKAFRIYNRHTRRIVETIHVDFDELTAMASEHRTPEAIAPIAELIPLGYTDSTGSPSLTTVEQDAPSTSNSPTPTETQSSPKARRGFFLKLNLSDHKSIFIDLQETLKGRWRYLIPAEPQIHNHMLIQDYQDIIFQDFCYSDGFECYQVIKIGRVLAQSIRSSNAVALDSPYLLILIIVTSQSRQHVDTSLIHLESRKSPTAEMFDVDSGRISNDHCEY